MDEPAAETPGALVYLRACVIFTGRSATGLFLPMLLAALLLLALLFLHIPNAVAAATYHMPLRAGGRENESSSSFGRKRMGRTRLRVPRGKTSPNGRKACKPIAAIFGKRMGRRRISLSSNALLLLVRGGRLLASGKLEE